MIYELEDINTKEYFCFDGTEQAAVVMYWKSLRLWRIWSFASKEYTNVEEREALNIIEQYTEPTYQKAR